MGIIGKKENIQEQIESIQMKLSLVNSAITKANDEQKLIWHIQRLDLQERLQQCFDELAVCTEKENDTANFAVGNLMSEADANDVLNAILYGKEPAAVQTDTDFATADAMCNALLKEDCYNSSLNFQYLPVNNLKHNDVSDSEIVAAEAMLNQFLLETENLIKEPGYNNYNQNESTFGKNETFLPSQHFLKNTDVLSVEDYLQLRRQAEQLITEAEKMLERTNAETDRIKREAERIHLNTETERAMFAAEMELERGRRKEEDGLRIKQLQNEKNRLAEKIARRKAEITALRNGLQEVKGSDSAFVLREKFFSIQTVLDEEERLSPEITYLLAKSFDDIYHSLEVSQLKCRIARLTKRVLQEHNAVKKKVSTNVTFKQSPAAVYKKRMVSSTHAQPNAIKSDAKPRRRNPIRPNEPRFY